MTVGIAVDCQAGGAVVGSAALAGLPGRCEIGGALPDLDLGEMKVAGLARQRDADKPTEHRRGDVDRQHHGSDRFCVFPGPELQRRDLDLTVVGDGLQRQGVFARVDARNRDVAPARAARKRLNPSCDA
ncbi:MAG TPA: hypothetical protein EYP98_02795 [Planctomycetes bacterium]|nr:hypothetical protein [Planctomycetota bacterium]